MHTCKSTALSRHWPGHPKFSPLEFKISAFVFAIFYVYKLLHSNVNKLSLIIDIDWEFKDFDLVFAYVVVNKLSGNSILICEVGDLNDF